MALNTVRTTIGYLLTLLRKTGLVSRKRDTVERIYNYVPISTDIGTSGQPSEADLQLIKAAGYTSVVNLAPHGVENSLADEAGSVSRLGLRYIHIPVDFKQPTDADFAQFVNTMQSLEGSKVWVHCAANMRVSAFMFRYRRDILAVDEAIAARDLARIWNPFGVWKAFVDKR